MTAAVAERGERAPPRRFVIVAPGDEHALPVVRIVRANTVGILDAMESQSRFVRVATASIPGKGAHVTVWRRRDAH